MSKIKTREIVAKGIKTLDRAVVAGERMKSACIRAKENAAGAVDSSHESPNEYAGNKAEYAAKEISRRGARAMCVVAQKTVLRGREAFQRRNREQTAREKMRERSVPAEQPATRSDVPNGAEQPADVPGGEARPHQFDKVTAKENRLPRSAPDEPYQESELTPAQKSQRVTAGKNRMQKADTDKRQSPKNTKPMADRGADAAGNPIQTWNDNNPRVKAPSVSAARSEQADPTQPVIRNRGSLRIGQQTAKATREQARAAERISGTTGKTAQKTAKKTQRAIKAADHSSKAAVKTAERTAKTSIRTAETSEKMARRAAPAAAKAARATVRTTRAVVKAAAATVKTATKAVARAIKASTAAIKSLVIAIVSGGWAPILVIVLIGMIGLLLGSCFGIFFSGEDTGTGQTMRTVVREINGEYQNQIDSIMANHVYDVLEMSGTRAVWPEVLAVYAVKTTSDPDNPQEVASMDDGKKALLKEIFWAMNEVNDSTSTVSHDVVTETDDGHGNIVETTARVTETTLHITVSHKTAEEMADFYNFTADQRAQLAELLSDENLGLWSAVLYGIGTGDGEIVEVALSQIGNVGGQPYWSWYGFSSRVEWCACFVSWCADQCGYIEAGIIPKFAGCVGGTNWFKDRGLWQDRNYEPRPGDIIFFDWDDPGGYSGPQDGLPDHVGIVEKVENGRVYTVEGNSGDSCRENFYPVGYYEIYGYGTPAY